MDGHQFLKWPMIASWSAFSLTTLSVSLRPLSAISGTASERPAGVRARCAAVQRQRTTNELWRHIRRFTEPAARDGVDWAWKKEEIISIRFSNYFGGLVLGCIEAEFAKKYSFCRIFKSCTAHFCTALMSAFQKWSSKHLLFFSKNSFFASCVMFVGFLIDFDEINCGNVMIIRGKSLCFKT